MTPKLFDYRSTKDLPKQNLLSIKTLLIGYGSPRVEGATVVLFFPNIVQHLLHVWSWCLISGELLIFCCHWTPGPGHSLFPRQCCTSVTSGTRGGSRLPLLFTSMFQNIKYSEKVPTTNTFAQESRKSLLRDYQRYFVDFRLKLQLGASSEELHISPCSVTSSTTCQRIQSDKFERWTLCTVSARHIYHNTPAVLLWGRSTRVVIWCVTLKFCGCVFA